MLQKNLKAGYKLLGHFEPQFERVVRRFESCFEAGYYMNAQLCVYYKDKPVIDVYGSTPVNGKECNRDSLIQVFSSGKTLGNILIAKMREQGLLKYDEKVAEYWPEFAQNGKEDITVADVLRHDARLHKFTKLMEFE